MSATHPASLAREALLLANQGGDERHCHALMELLETGTVLASALRAELARANLTESGFRILAQLVREPSGTFTPASLADAVRISPQTVSVLLSRLELAGLLSRTPASGNRRALSVALTAHGLATFKAAARRLIASASKLMTPLASDEIGALDRNCIRLRTACEGAAAK